MQTPACVWSAKGAQVVELKPERSRVGCTTTPTTKKIRRVLVCFVCGVCAKSELLGR